MKTELSRRQFIKTVATGAAAATGLGVMGELPRALAMAPEGQQAAAAGPVFEGKPKFSGVHNVRKLSEDLYYLGASDSRLELFENVYPIPRGVSYNAYLLLDEKTVLLDTVDRSVSGQFFENLVYALNGKPLNYMIINHMEPDHCAAISEVLTRWPEAKLVCSELAAPMIEQFFGFKVEDHGFTVKEGDTLVTGRHTLAFVMAPMVHWPEAMVTYDATDKALFSADAFGSFGALGGSLYADQVNFDKEWLADARRYYTNIVGKYGPRVQEVLQKAGTIEISTIYPLHGPIWREDLGYILDKYNRWSSYTPEEDAVVIIYGSVYGGTENAARVLASRLADGGIQDVRVYDASKTHVSELVAEAFRVSHLVFAGITYNNDVFTPLKNVLTDFADHNLQKRAYSLIENGTWAPVAASKMKGILDGMKDMQQVGQTVTIKSTTNQENFEQLGALAQDILASFQKA